MEACLNMMPQHNDNGNDRSEPMNELPYLLLAESNCYQADQIINGKFFRFLSLWFLVYPKAAKAIYCRKYPHVMFVVKYK